MTDFEYELRRRIVIERDDVNHDEIIGVEINLDDWQYDDDPARIAANHFKDVMFPLAATAVVRRDARDTTGPDLAAFNSAFATALQQHDEEYL